MTTDAQRWDVRWAEIYDDLCADGYPGDAAAEIADRECVEQFGPRPPEEAMG